MTIRWPLQPDVPDPLPPDALALLLQLQHATTIHDAHELAVDAVKAGATGQQVRDAINQWISLQGRQVQTVVSTPTRCRCSHGASVHTGGVGHCWQHPCACDRYDDPAELAACQDRHPAGKGLDPDKPFPSRFDDRYIDSAEPKNRSIQ